MAGISGRWSEFEQRGRRRPFGTAHQVATLLDLTGTPHDQTQLLVDLLDCLALRLRQLGAGDPALGQSFDSMCLQHGRTLMLYVGDRTIRGRCLRIATDGALVLETERGGAIYAGTLRPPEHGANA